jgi:hypothetical protein
LGIVNRFGEHNLADFDPHFGRVVIFEGIFYYPC